MLILILGIIFYYSTFQCFHWAEKKRSVLTLRYISTLLSKKNSLTPKAA